MQVIEQDFDIADVLKMPLMANLSTAGERGACESPVWFLWEDEHLWLIASAESGFVKRLRSDPRASIGIVDFDVHAGILRHVGMRGIAALLDAEASRRTRLVERYLGPEVSWNPWFKANIVEKQDVLIRFTPETAVARDQSYFR